MLAVEGTPSKRRHFVADKENSQPGQETPSSDKGDSDLVLCSNVTQKVERDVNSALGVSFMWLCNCCMT